MKFLAVFALITCAFAHNIGRTLPKDRIIGGTLASKGQFPYQISERYFGQHICGGSIIDVNTILTAAHCVDGMFSMFLSIVAGSNKLNEGGEWHAISRYIIHEKWNSVLATNDIAVIKLKDAIKFTTYIQPIVVDETFTPADVQCVLSGWGVTSYPANTPPNDLLHFNGQVVDLDECKEILAGGPYPVLDTNICSYAKYGVGACVGDSGGPLVNNKKQIGIASFVAPCGIGAPDVFTRVSSYSDWIKKQQLETN